MTTSHDDAVPGRREIAGREKYAANELIGPEDQADVLTFLARVRPLEGCTYDGDERLEHGREVILRWIAECAASAVGSDPEPRLPQIAQRELVYECAEAVYFLDNLNPIEHPGGDDDWEHALSGQHRILGWIEKRLLRASGYADSRPHRTTVERLRAAVEEQP